MEQDAKIKRAIFIDGAHYLLEEFRRVNPEIQSKLVTLYNSACYGSNTWNLFGEWSRKLQTCWNVNLKQIWSLPHQTYRYFFDHLTQCKHLKILLLKRFLTFIISILKGENSSCKFLLRTVSGNSNSITGHNIRNLEIESGIPIDIQKLQLHIDNIIDSLYFQKTPPGESWRINALKDLSQVKSGHFYLEGFNMEEVEEMLHFICTS